MRPGPRRLFAFLVARMAFGLVFLASAAGHWVVPWYLPLAHRWQLASRVNELGMDWYGRSLYALTAALLAGLCAWALCALPRVAGYFSRPSRLRIVAHLGAVLLFNDVVFYSASLLTRQVTPAPPPAWYCPR